VKVTVVDYGAGNLHSVRRALEAVGADVERATTPEQVARAERVVLPGVGAFPAAMAALRAQGLDEALVAAAGRGTPLLGVCLGMQLLLAGGTEHAPPGAPTRGLGLLPGLVERLPSGVRVPHMGWHRLALRRATALLPEPFPVYFAHSYFVSGAHRDAVAVVDHGVPIAAAVARDGLFGCQFHPEKSGAAGLGLLRRFVGA
jgi:imidazole glycerol-phosphate synthase subunit HisH